MLVLKCLAHMDGGEPPLNTTVGLIHSYPVSMDILIKRSPMKISQSSFGLLDHILVTEVDFCHPWDKTQPQYMR